MPFKLKMSEKKLEIFHLTLSSMYSVDCMHFDQMPTFLLQFWQADKVKKKTEK